MYEQTETSPNSNSIKLKRQEKLQKRNCQKLPLSSSEEKMDRGDFLWGATAEVVKITRRREKSPKMKRLFERRLEIARPSTMRRC